MAWTHKLFRPVNDAELVAALDNITKHVWSAPYVIPHGQGWVVIGRGDPRDWADVDRRQAEIDAQPPEIVEDVEP